MLKESLLKRQCTIENEKSLYGDMYTHESIIEGLSYNVPEVLVLAVIFESSESDPKFDIHHYNGIPILC